MAYASFTNADAGTQPRGAIVRAGPAPGQCVLAVADTVAHVTTLLGLRLANVLSGNPGQIGSLDDLSSLVLMEAAPSVGDPVYVSATTPGTGTPTAPPLVVPIGICYQVQVIGGSTYASVVPVTGRTVPGSLTGTLAQAYASGTTAADQTLALLDTKGGKFIVDGSSASFTSLVAMQVKGDYLQTGLARTALAASIEVVGANFNFAVTKQWATGAITTQREVLFQAPTYSFVGPSTMTTAATVAITNAPAQGTNATITNPYALLVQAGSSSFVGNVGINNTILPSTRLEVVEGSSTGTTGNATHPGTIKITNNAINGPENNGGLEIQYNVGSNGFGIKIFTDANNDRSGWAYRVNSTTWTKALVINHAKGGSLAVGTSAADPATAFLVNALNPNSITANAGASWNNVQLSDAALTITGSTTITELDFIKIGTISVSGGVSVTVSDFYTLRLPAASFIGAGPAVATRNYSLGVDGNAKFSGGQTVKGTNVNSGASPYTVKQTDYAIECRTLSGAITIDLPSIAVEGNGRIVISIDSDYNSAVQSITVVPNGADKINNVAGNYTQNINGSSVWFKANATTGNWEII